MQGYENVSVFSPRAGVGASADPEGGQGGPDPPPPQENHKLYEFL